MRISLNALHFSESDFPKEFINQPHQYQINKAPYTKTENTFSAAFFWEGGYVYNTPVQSTPLFCAKHQRFKFQKDLSTRTKVITSKPFYLQTVCSNDNCNSL